MNNKFLSFLKYLMHCKHFEQTFEFMYDFSALINQICTVRDYQLNSSIMNVISVSGSSMLLVLLCWFVGVTALLYILYSWLIPAVVQFNGSLALLWHDVIVERALDTLTRSTRPQVTQTGLVKQFSITIQNYRMYLCPTSATRMLNGTCDPKTGVNDVKLLRPIK